MQKTGGSVETAASSLEAELAAKNDLVRRQAEQIAHLQQELDEARSRDQQTARNIELLSREKEEISAALENMKGSAGWKLVRRFRRAKERLLPLGTLRRRLYDQLLVRVKNSHPASTFEAGARPVMQQRAAEGPPSGEEICRAHLVLRSGPSLVEAGQAQSVSVEVTNLNSYKWHAGRQELEGHGSVTLSYDWYDDSGKWVGWEGERTCLPRDLEPQNSTTVDVRIFAPFVSGAYTLQIALVHGGMARSDQKGSAPLRSSLQVEPSPLGLSQLTSCSIVVPVFNRAAFTKACLLAIERSISGDRIPYEVIVVDNGSTDGTLGLLSSWSSSRANARVVTLGRNLGFARACNEGARLARGNYLVLLNNDTLPTPAWLEKMLDLAEHEPQVGIVGSKLLYPDGRIQHIGVAFGENKNPRHIYRGFSSNIRPAKVSREYQAVTGACLLMKKELYDAAGGMDEAYWNSYEDVDLCLKTRARGHRVFVCADSILYHFESMSEGRLAHDFRNAALFKTRWEDKIEVDLAHWYALDHLKDPMGEFESLEGYDPGQEQLLGMLWKRLYSGDIPDI